MARLIRQFATWLVAIAIADSATAENWPSWRGPRGDGTSLESQLPTEWDGESGHHIFWKIPLAGKGHASPIVWNDRIFLTSCLESEQQRALFCFDTATGEELWRSIAFRSPLESIHQLNSFASGTPATDGDSVFTCFLKVDGTKISAPNVGTPREITPGRIVVTAFDFEGQQRWQVDVGEFISAHGFCSSPVLYGELLIVNGDHDGKGYLVALDKSDGSVVWRTPRQHGIRSYVTPIIRTIEGQDQLVLSGSEHIASFDPSDGEMIWTVDGPTEQYVASMVFDGHRFLMAAGYPTHHVMAIRPDGRGDVTRTHVAWHVDKYVRCYVPSPVLVGQRLFVADDRGTANCFNAADGTRIWQARMGGTFSASLVASPELVYLLANDGTMTVVEPAAELKVKAKNSLGEPCSASPAISNGQLYLRGEKHLFRIGEVPGRGDSDL